MKSRVSVVVYNYNYGKFLNDAVDSVLTQAYPEIEVVVLDNGSTDDSLAVLRRYDSDPRVTVLPRKDNSIKGARFNEPFAHCAGDFIAILYADDYFLPERIAKQVACFEHLGRDCGVVYSPAWRLNVLTGERWRMRVNGKSGIGLEDLLRGFFTDGYVVPVATLIRRECLERYPFFPDMDYEGEGIYLRIAMRYKFHCLDEPLAVMREHGSNLGKAIRHNAKDLIPYLRRLEADPDFPPSASAALRDFRSRKLLDYGWQGVRMLSDGAWARRHLAAAVAEDPWMAAHPRAVAGFALSFLPDSWLSGLNRLANRLVRRKENVGVVEDIRART